MRFSVSGCLHIFSKLWFYFVILLVAQGVRATVTVDAGTCGAILNDVQDALREAIAMAGNAASRQSGLRDTALNLADWRVTLNTFYAYFGRFASPEIHPQSPYTAPNAVEISNKLIGKSSSDK